MSTYCTLFCIFWILLKYYTRASQSRVRAHHHIIFLIYNHAEMRRKVASKCHNKRCSTWTYTRKEEIQSTTTTSRAVLLSTKYVLCIICIVRYAYNVGQYVCIVKYQLRAVCKVCIYRPLFYYAYYCSRVCILYILDSQLEVCYYYAYQLEQYESNIILCIQCMHTICSYAYQLVVCILQYHSYELE